MAEWSNAAVLKTVVRATGPGVRIPLSPPDHLQTKPARMCGFLLLRPVAREKLALEWIAGLKTASP